VLDGRLYRDGRAKGEKPEIFKIYSDFEKFLLSDFDKVSDNDISKAKDCFKRLNPKYDSIDKFKNFFKKKSLFLISKAKEQVMRTYEFGLSMNESIMKKIAMRNRYLAEGHKYVLQ